MERLEAYRASEKRLLIGAGHGIQKNPGKVLRLPLNPPIPTRNDPTTTPEKKGIKNANFDTVLVLLRMPHPFPNSDLLSNKPLVGYSHAPGTQLKFGSPRPLLLFGPVVLWYLDYIPT